MATSTPQEIPIQITSTNSSSERRIALSWTVARLKAKLVPVTGIPPPAQRLLLRRGIGTAAGSTPGGEDGRNEREEVIEATDEENTTLDQWRLARGFEIYVCFISFACVCTLLASELPLYTLLSSN